MRKTDARKTAQKRLPKQNPHGAGRTRMILDTDTNNEVGDQHAIAYAFFSGDVFDLCGVAVNKTRNGGSVAEHYGEAERGMKLCGAHGIVPLRKGAEGAFPRILPFLNANEHSSAGDLAPELLIGEGPAPEPHGCVRDVRRRGQRKTSPGSPTPVGSRTCPATCVRGAAMGLDPVFPAIPPRKAT